MGLMATIFFERFFIEAIALAVIVSLQRGFHGLVQISPFSVIDFCSHSNFVVSRLRSITIF
jgi:hypothetical protein